ncbi:MAG: ABC transporter ATP-binding protein [Candidatus Hatepunaea meridiana]|nr:ABC transporter ATP-binding protein [Candidatus Hatepunaea meridiana]
MNLSTIVETQNVIKNYDNGRVQALRGVDVTIHQGCFLAFAGPSGSGKTTLLNLIGALDVPDEGTVIVGGENLKSLSEKERTALRRVKIGFIFQQFNLVPVLTACENVELPLEILPGYTKSSRRDAALNILKQVGLTGKEHRLPNKLSGGEQQRVAVARALVKKPVIVLADEPTANLDSETGKAIVDLMKQMRDEYNTSFILSTHDPRVMERTEAIFRLVDGRIEE